MKNASIVAASVAILFLAGNAIAAAPQVGFVNPGPGINAPLDNDGQPVNYGIKVSETPNWVYDGDSASAGPVEPFGSANQTFNSSLFGDNENGVSPQTKMDVSKDWVLEIVFRHTGDFGGEWPFFVKNTQLSDAPILHLRHVGGSSDDTWELWAADDSPNPLAAGWAKVTDAAPLGSDFNTFVFHYKAASQTIDAYQNDVLFAPDFTLAHGDFAASMVAIEWSRAAGVDSFRSVKLGQLVPEPGSLALFALGLIGCGCWRSRAADRR